MSSRRRHSVGSPVTLKDKEVAKINKAMVEMANNFNLGVDEDDI